ncbi:hypothetical protein, partial [Synechococcus lacustris]|uniref:hypothetical protein n=1 Tax=Synechococcus lacustris TaxID=2116544 RepID=UPI00333E868A
MDQAAIDEAFGSPFAPPSPAEEKQGINLQEISESVLVAFPDMTEAEGGLIPLSRFTPEEQASLRNSGIVESAQTSEGNTYEGVNSEYLWQRRKQFQDDRAAKSKITDLSPAASAPVASATIAPKPTGSPELIAGEGAPVSLPAPKIAATITPNATAPVAATKIAPPVSLMRGDIFTDESGQPFQVWKNRQGTIEAHPIIDGKAVVNNASGVRFSVTDEAAARNPNDRILTPNASTAPAAASGAPEPTGSPELIAGEGAPVSTTPDAPAPRPFSEIMAENMKRKGEAGYIDLGVV